MELNLPLWCMMMDKVMLNVLKDDMDDAVVV